MLSSGGRFLHDYRRAHSQLGNLGVRRLRARAGAVCVILRRVRANSGARRARLLVRVRNSLRQPSDARHVGQNDSRSGQHVDVGGADLLPKRGGGGELAQGEGSQRRWGKPRADARGLTHRHQVSSGGPRERAPRQPPWRVARSVGRWLDEDPHWPNPRLVCGNHVALSYTLTVKWVMITRG